MLNNYISIAWRHILKNKVYSSINILGLVLGLSVFFFGSLLADYETSHDLFYKNSERIFTIGSVFKPGADVGVLASDAAHSALAPIVKTEMPDIEAVARTISREFLISIEDDDYYENIRFADSSFLNIFDFTYIEGDDTAINDPTGLLVTQDMALKLFGEGPALGKFVVLDHDKTLTVTAVVANLPKNTHFNSSLDSDEVFSMVAHLSVLNTDERNEEEGNWNNLSMGDYTYVLAKPKLSQSSLQVQMDALYDTHYPIEENDFISSFKVSKLSEANTFLWSAVGMPVIETVQLLAFFVLIVAIVNYTNLATAQSLGRTREVGLRKTMGAGRAQLLAQFLTESILIALISMLIALALLEIAIPIFNTTMDKGLTINYLSTLPWLLLTTLLVGLMAGAYPAYLITQTNPIDALRNSSTKGAKGNLFRSLMLGVQFSISIFILAIVLVVYFQNLKLERSGDIYARSQIVTLKRLNIPDIKKQLKTLENELSAIGGVSHVAFSSQVPFQQSNSSFEASPIQGDDTNTVSVNQVSVNSNFLRLYDIPLLTGRELSDEYDSDTLKEDVYTVNVVVNKLFMEKLGFTLESENPTFYDSSDNRPSRAYSIVGVVADQNFKGFHNVIKPMVFFMRPAWYSTASVRVQGADIQRTMIEIKDAWTDVVPNYPIQVEFLDETFMDVFKIFNAMTKTLGGFAFLAISLSMVGLFGMAAFMVERRTKEIGIRKVMGANLGQIVTLLIWQFSKPVLWSLVVSLPAAYFASNTYLNFFADRLTLPLGIIISAGLMATLFSWLIISFHSIKIARANPIRSLRYE
mgnify:CR=1 FL=1